MNTKKQNKAGNSIWETFDTVTGKYKLGKLKTGGFEVVDYNAIKNYQQKRIEVNFEVLYEVEKKKWGVCKDISCIYNDENIDTLEPNIKHLIKTMKTQDIIKPGMKREECRTGKIKQAGWYIYYLN